MKQTSSTFNFESIEINEKYCGPPKSGNGGYIAGIAAKPIQKDAAVIKIKSPGPLNETLYYSLNSSTNGIKLLSKDADVVIAEAQEDPEFFMNVPELNSSILEDIQNPEEEYLGFQRHPFPTCFVCGPQRKQEDGMRIFPAKIPDQVGFTHLHGDFWNPWKDLGDADGKIRNEIVWAALDCPGGFAVSYVDPTMIVLVKLRGRILESLFTEVPYAILSWEIGRNRRQRTPGTAIYRISDRKCVAYSEALWMVPGNWNPENQKEL
ncbi:hypothetical protein [Leptospira stimsonii]|uniref:Uncharacterized protein n=1 Tax=Leptospira stimsonii TaxID=2202203 RepID=A0ABY2NDB6_9LEPT|nr:hypothetical protein [Leptospira stimsonii]TGK18526.1 hypothetical protein EHO98_13045 [Leptospira stimsonii]TGM21834.1 hypothetical protein EHQ90_01480 [Leptospira stimsonii]